jgi:hypothetical protein
MKDSKKDPIKLEEFMLMDGSGGDSIITKLQK